MGTLFAEMKRRNVLRVGAAYAVIGWLVAQILDLAVDNFGAPDWVMKMALVALLGGLPVVLVFAWAFELTPDGVKRTDDVEADASVTPTTGHKLDHFIIAALVVALGYFVWESRFEEPAPGETQTAITEIERSIAVLPFVNMSEDASNAYFADGLSEEILNVLVGINDLKVAGRTSSFQFRGQNLDIRDIGRTLGVAHILEGSVRKQGERVRITAQLIRADDGFHLWSAAYNRDLADIFAVQEEIATAIADAMAIKLGGPERVPLVKAQTASMEAYQLYLEARTLIARRGDAEIARAVQLLSQVVQIDPSYAGGWGVLAQAHALSAYYGTSRPQAVAAAETAAGRALELDPNLAMAHSALGDIYRDSSRWSEAEQSYLRALALNPGEAETYSQYAQMLTRTGYFEEALKLFERALEIDPMSPISRTGLALDAYYLGDTERAHKESVLAIRLNPDLGTLHWGRLGFHLGDGNVTGALADQKEVSRTIALRKPDSMVVGLYDKIMAEGENAEAVLEHLRIMLSETGNTGNVAAWLWATEYGDPGLAMQLARRELETLGAPDTMWIWFSALAPMRQQDDFERLLRDMKMDVYWRERGWPYMCRPLGEDDFECD